MYNKDMQQSFLAIRAIATTFALRIYKPVVISAGIASLLAVLLIIWLLTISAWWWLLAVPVFGLVLIAATVLIIVGIVLSMISPNVSKLQRKSISQFIDHIQELSEITATPKFILLFRILKDAASPQKTAYIESVISGVGSLRKEFNDIVKSF